MKYDSVIIGFGKGGKTLAAALAGRGEKVAVIEKSNKMYGGTCINVGCIPSKSLVRSSGLSRLNSTDSFDAKDEKYKKAIEEKRRVTSMLRQKNYDKLNNLSNVTVIDGTASFLSNTEVLIKKDGAENKVSADKIFINTGSTAVIPDIEGINNSPKVFTSETLMELEKLPRNLTIIGGGYIGLEFASMYSNFGSRVTVIQDGGVFIPKEDRDIANEIQKVLEENGVSFIFSAKTYKIDGADVYYKKEENDFILNGDAVLIATGRRPNTDGLCADKAGVELTARGAVKVDDELKTTASNIWAMGDVCGSLQFTYVSLDDCRIVLSQLNKGEERKVSSRRNVPYSVFISPSFSRVGLSEKEALEKGYKIKVAKLPAAAVPKAQVLKQTSGLLKAVIDADTDKILGAMLFCEESYEMINIVKLAMDMEADYRVLRDNIYTHPTMSEALNDLFAV